MSEAAEQMMTPEASPHAVSKKTGVRRVNDIPMYLLAVVLGLFLLVMALVAANRSAKQNAHAAQPPERTGSTSMFAREIAGDQPDGIVSADKSYPPELPNLATDDQSGIPVLLVKPDDLDTPPRPPKNGHLNQPAHDEEANRIRMAKLQMFEEAIKAKTAVQVAAPRSSGSTIGGSSAPPKTREEMIARLAAVRQQIDAQLVEDPTAAYQARLSQIRRANIGGVGAAGGSTHSDSPKLLQAASKGDRYAQFDVGNEGDRWSLDTQPEAPRTPFELRAGFVVPATLVSGINSELPGQIMAQVSQNVYDTATGQHLLIPQGARLVGVYSNDIAYGQSRVLIAWQRIVFPDGKAMDIGAMPGSDSAGYSGFKDKVNHHYFRVFASAVLMSGVTAGISLSQDRDNYNSDKQRASDAMSEALGQQLGQVTAQLIAKNLNIAPTIEIRPGYRFNVIVTKDMVFSKPYRSFDY